MVNKTNRSEKQLASIKEVCQRLAEKLDARISLRLWDGSLHPLGSNVLEGYEISISGPGVIGAMIRRPTAENLLCLYARGHVDFQGANIVEFMRTARVKGSRRRSRSIPKLLAAKAFFNFALARNVDASSELRFQGDDQGFHRKQSDNRDFIKFHYDIGNEFYKLFLDKEMVYSCAYFRSWDESLEQAQRNKLDMICRKLQLKPGDRMLDIGCGWGALICYAAEHYGVKAHGITLSDAQLEIAHQRIEERGLQGRVTAAICDYNDVQGEYDKVSSVGMAEHVGIKNLPNYMQKVRSVLVPGGLFLNHAITRPAKSSARKFNRKNAERRLLTKYIFPGGELDHQGHVLDSMESSGFEVHDVEGWRDHYGLTCEHWARRLEANKTEAIRMVGEEKYRMWLLYLGGVAMALQDGSARIFQTVATKQVQRGHSGMPPTREHLYATDSPRRLPRVA
ncbi:MAG: class I SAM-dependent methyltransferase [Pirellulaceae bacterium]|jgi:cyclopropane-fatty-acyl-phospholipid synthase|nr:class I SAM-dependent methyltransferase [Pirellulaceae bacterium]